MTNKITLTITLLILILLTGCTGNPKPSKYKQLRTKHLKNFLQHYKQYESSKAIAVAVDEDKGYIVGYSYDCNSTESAKNKALRNCIHAKNSTNIKVDDTCTLYAIENHILRK